MGLFRGTALFLSIVIGAGLLTLPGLAVQVAGDHALLAWLACSLAGLPFLAILIELGRRYPEAGGISAYAGRAFGRVGADIAGLLFLGAVVFGLPSIALAGGHYLSAISGIPAHPAALMLLMGALLPHLIPGEGASRVMSFIASLVLLAIVGFLVVGFAGLTSNISFSSLVPSSFSWNLMMAPMMMLFFAFTGWEVGASAAEEFKNPERDYPLAMLISFILATILYLSIAILVQQVDLVGRYEAPFLVIITPLLGSLGEVMVALVAVAIVYANLVGAIWGVSRLVFGLARDGSLPHVLAKTTFGQPRLAVWVTLATLMSVVVADWVAGFGLKTMLGLAGQNFVILFGVAAASLFVLAKSRFDRFLAASVALLVLALMVLQGETLLYPIALVASLIIRYSIRALVRRKASTSES
jgi:amino acid efflux transporter